VYQYPQTIAVSSWRCRS